jgi:hypothetical protein
MTQPRFPLPEGRSSTARIMQSVCQRAADSPAVPGPQPRGIGWQIEKAGGILALVVLLDRITLYAGASGLPLNEDGGSARRRRLRFCTQAPPACR